MVCRAIANGKRVEMWQTFNGAVPEGQRVGWTCRVAYCGEFEHMVLTENRNSKRCNWREITARFKNLDVGDYIELPATEHLGKLKSALAMGVGMLCYSIRTAQDRGRVRIYRVGSWDDREAVKQFRASLPVINGWLTNISDRIGKHPPIYFFGFLGGSAGSVMHRFESAKYVRPCEVKGCPFPRNGSVKCHRHQWFGEYARGMKWRHIDQGDLFANEDRNIEYPTFSVLGGWQLSRSFEYTKFFHNKVIDRGVLLSDQWWNENVSLAIGSGAMWGGKSGHKGYGIPKIRKSQRKRPAGYVGSHPDQKPFKVKRQSIADLPAWTPADEQYTKLNATYDDFEEVFQDSERLICCEENDDEERDYLSSLLDGEFSEFDFSTEAVAGRTDSASY